MSNFLVCLNAILPIFLIMAVGYLCRHVGIIREGEPARFNAVAFRIFLPLSCFYNIYQSDLSRAVHPRLLLYAVVAVLLSIALSWWYGTRFVDRRDRKGVVIQGLYRSNFVIIGMPLATYLIDAPDYGPVAVLIAIVVPLFNVFAVITLETFNGEKVSRKKLVIDILKNPLIIGCIAGLVFLLLHIRLPSFAEKAVSDMAKAASPLMLFLLGASFRFSSMQGQARELIAVCVGRLIVIPAIFLTLAALLGFRGLDFVGLLCVFASCTAVSSFSMAQQMGGDADLAGNIVVMTSLLCSVTLFLWSFVFLSLGIF